MDDQKALCKKYNLTWTPSDEEKMVAFSKSFNPNLMPINGLRHPISATTTGWYIWSGGEFPITEEFEVRHTAHIADLYPLINKYLGLPCGWRFQIDNKGYEDVWEDKALLNV